MLQFSEESIKEYFSHPKIAAWYQHYLASQRWQAKKEKVRKRAQNKCEECFTEVGPFSVHHKTYERVTVEKLEDLLFVCQTCHKLLHNKRIIPFSERIYEENYKLLLKIYE